VQIELVCFRISFAHLSTIGLPVSKNHTGAEPGHSSSAGSVSLPQAIRAQGSDARKTNLHHSSDTSRRRYSGRGERAAAEHRSPSSSGTGPRRAIPYSSAYRPSKGRVGHTWV